MRCEARKSAPQLPTRNSASCCGHVRLPEQRAIKGPGCSLSGNARPLFLVAASLFTYATQSDETTADLHGGAGGNVLPVRSPLRRRAAQGGGGFKVRLRAHTRHFI